MKGRWGPDGGLMKKYFKAKQRYFPVLCGVRFAAKGIVVPPQPKLSSRFSDFELLLKKHHNNKIILAGAS